MSSNNNENWLPEKAESIDSMISSMKWLGEPNEIKVTEMVEFNFWNGVVCKVSKQVATYYEKTKDLSSSLIDEAIEEENELNRRRRDKEKFSKKNNK